ncbi:MAG: hypothetical protein WCH85_00020 [Methanomicrobiales archaeon]
MQEIIHRTGPAGFCWGWLAHYRIGCVGGAGLVLIERTRGRI